MVIELSIMFILLIGIFALLRVRNYLYNKQNLKVGPYEDVLFCISFFLGLLSIGILKNEKIWMLLALPFFVYLLTPVILFSMRQWKEFLGLLNSYLNRR
jgi:hypothetical protein